MSKTLNYHALQNCEEGFVYLVDCTLATVETLACKKKPPVGEYLRQIEMAQRSINCLIETRSELYGTRAEEVYVKFAGSVQGWANAIHKSNFP